MVHAIVPFKIKFHDDSITKRKEDGLNAAIP